MEVDDEVHGGKAAAGWSTQEVQRHPSPVFQQLFEITGAEEGEIKEQRRGRGRGRKSHFSDLFMTQGRYTECIRTCSSGHTVREDEVSS